MIWRIALWRKSTSIFFKARQSLNHFPLEEDSKGWQECHHVYSSKTYVEEGDEDERWEPISKGARAGVETLSRARAGVEASARARVWITARARARATSSGTRRSQIHLVRVCLRFSSWSQNHDPFRAKAEVSEYTWAKVLARARVRISLSQSHKIWNP